VPQALSWEKTWTALFTKLLTHVIKLDFALNEYWDDLDKLENRLLSIVVPRLLRVLETEGLTIKPSLLHADLWEGNTGTCSKTGKVYILDAAAFYAHHEMEDGNWQYHYNKIYEDGVYIDSYSRYQQPAVLYLLQHHLLGQSPHWRQSSKASVSPSSILNLPDHTPTSIQGLQ